MPDCLFCKIIKGEIQGKFVYQDKEIVAFHDINPKAPVHVLIVPVRHIASLAEVKQKDSALLGKMFVTLNKIADQLGVRSTGFKVVINSGRDSGQLIFHLHAHLLGGWKDKNLKFDI